MAGNLGYIKMSNGHDADYYDTELLFSDDIQDNLDGTYTLTGNFSRVKLSQWYDNYKLLVNKFICPENELTCENPYYTVSTYETFYRYENASKNFKYANDFEYDFESGTYKLKNTIDLFDIYNNSNQINNHHYTCFNKTGVCNEISYIYQNYTSLSYINLSNNKNINDAINEMLYNDDVNKSDSKIKLVIDAWYKGNLLKYQDYLEDIVYCNGRNILNYSGWNPDGGNIDDFLYFNMNDSITSFACLKNKDRFTVSSDYGNGDLTYPVGLLNSNEAKSMHLKLFLDKNFLLLNPSRYDRDLYMASFKYSGYTYYLPGRERYLVATRANSSEFIRPVISLKPGIEYIQGDGTAEKPYVIQMD